MKLTIQHRQVLQGIPSASGIVKIEDDLYVIGDNSPYLFQLNAEYEITNRHLLLKNIKEHIISKALKPDFEAMTSIPNNNDLELLIFGSGSKSPERDSISRIKFKDGFQTTIYDATELYSALRSSNYLDSESLNIEAATTFEKKLYLFNRENNLLITYQLDNFLEYLEGSKNLPTYQIYHIDLPQLNGLDAKFSGASAIPGSQQLIFTASVEDSPNTYDDGDVLGSYVGIINLENLKDGYQPECLLITDNLNPLLIKVESVEILKSIRPNELQIVMVTDSDGGHSELLVGTLFY